MEVSMWQIYDELIDLVAPEAVVDDCLVGLHWTLVRVGTGVGTAMTVAEGAHELRLAGTIRGMRARELAERVKSWNLCEASIGLATINAALNTPERVGALLGQPITRQTRVNAFTALRSQLQGRKVAVIGHFPGLEELRDTCQLSILERRPGPGDLPDPACEYILPDQDYVFITGTTLTNKTLPRLLELSRRAFVVLVGPSTPLSPVLFRHGIHMLAGTVVIDPGAVWRAAQEGGILQIFDSGGQMVTLTAAKAGVNRATIR
jgi:uncharacterized protein (DUF4213/DUF364 family)